MNENKEMEEFKQTMPYLLKIMKGLSDTSRIKMFDDLSREVFRRVDEGTMPFNESLKYHLLLVQLLKQARE